MSHKRYYAAIANFVFCLLHAYVSRQNLDAGCRHTILEHSLASLGGS